ncbi:hypothetical protein ACFSKU_09635 [Pontibacter silvestris]|uniref:Uncharacterized protein n=1 Tax=Pontibacter silvestris TaxID=2305183 RepID=A0ABW4WWN6_9BACT|nr:hypothetical protein [Pontibacter silvestris]MCC9137573.1 hypothetical protein [Pontibacter silvestris]
MRRRKGIWLHVLDVLQEQEPKLELAPARLHHRHGPPALGQTKNKFTARKNKSKRKGHSCNGLIKKAMRKRIESSFPK